MNSDYIKDSSKILKKEKKQNCTEIKKNAVTFLGIIQLISSPF